MFKRRKNRGLKQRNFLNRGRNNCFSHGFGKCHKNFHNGSEFNERQLVGLSEDFCPLCKNHCSLEEPGCTKGNEYLVIKKAA